MTTLSERSVSGFQDRLGRFLITGRRIVAGQRPEVITHAYDK